MRSIYIKSPVRLQFQVFDIPGKVFKFLPGYPLGEALVEYQFSGIPDFFIIRFTGDFQDQL